MKYLRRIRQSTITNQILSISSLFMMVGTIALAIFAAFQYFTLRNQLARMQDMIAQNERLINASQQQANASATSANVAQGEIRAVNDSAKAAKDSASAAKTITEQNKDLIAAARIQADASRTSARATEVQAAASKSQAAASEKMVGQNERIVKAAETQASAARTSEAISSQLTVGYIPKLVSLQPNQPMMADVHFVNKSNVIVSVTGGAVKYVFTEEGSITNNFSGGIPVQAFDLPPQWEQVGIHIPSKILSEKEVLSIQDGRLHVFLFMRIVVAGLRSPIDSCYVYNRLIKDFVACY